MVFENGSNRGDIELVLKRTFLAYPISFEKAFDLNKRIIFVHLTQYININRDSGVRRVFLK